MHPPVCVYMSVSLVRQSVARLILPSVTECFREHNGRARRTLVCRQQWAVWFDVSRPRESRLVTAADELRPLQQDPMCQRFSSGRGVHYRLH